MDLNCCTGCGKQLTYKTIGDEGEQKYCECCNKFYFDTPASCVLVAIINENNQVLLLKQDYISAKNYTLCSGYLKNCDTLEETGQHVISCEYVQSYYFAPKNLIMTGFITYIKASEFGSYNEVDGLM